MGIFSKFEGRMEDTFEGAANKMFDSPISPVQIAKKAEKKMRREKMVGAGKQYAPTLYTILVNAEDDQRLFGYYPTLAGETETYLGAKAVDDGLVMDGQPLVRFIVDEGLKRGKFEVIAEMVSSPIIEQLRTEEMDRYGIGNRTANQPGVPPMRSERERRGIQGRPVSQNAPAPQSSSQDPYGQGAYAQNPNAYTASPGNKVPDQYPADAKPPLPYVPENEIDYSISYGEYTFDSQNFDDYRENGVAVSSNGNAPSYGENEPETFYRRTSEPLVNPAAAMGNLAGDAAARAQAPVNVPSTVVFAPGSGNAQPIPNSAMVRACLLNTNDNRTYDLATARLLLGRDNSSDIVVDDINASRTHAELKLEQQGVWVITDLGSTNGTLVNGKEITSQVLRDGDYITIGMTNYVFIQA